MTITDTYFLYQGNLSPPPAYTIEEAGQPVDLTNKTVTFSMRLAGSSVLLLDHVPAQIVNAAQGQVTHAWQAGETNTPGPIVAWYTTNPTTGPASPQDTPEFTFPIFTHSLAWTSAADVAAVVGIDAATDPVGLQVACAGATDVMQSVLARQFRGQTLDTIRPARTECDCWGLRSFGLPLSWGNWAGWFGWGHWDRPEPLGCGSLSQITLSYPVASIQQVKVDGTVLDPSTYRVDEERFLVRLRDPDGTAQRWPACQDLTLPDSAVGTWSVTFVWGQAPPLLAAQAALDLAVQLYRAGNGQPCSLPVGATKVSRNGIQIDRGLLANWSAGQSTGIATVDAACRAYNPNGLTMRPAVFSPDVPRYGRHAGT